VAPRKLPLESPYWKPLAEAIRVLHQRTGSLALGEADTTQALRDGKLHSMCRRLGAEPERWPVPPRFWNDREVFLMSDDVVELSPEAEPFGLFFCWQPDLEKLASGVTKLKQQPVPTGGQTKHGAPLKYDWIEIVTEAAFRESTATKKEKLRSDNVEAQRLRAWCTRHLKQRPALSSLREIVKVVRRRFRGPN
jgi:hypothetical protein